MLSALRRAGSPYQLSPKALLQQTLVSSGTMTNRIDRLVERGLVERRGDPNDGRGILVTMTPTGQARVDAAISQLLDAEAELLDNLSSADQERIADAAAQAEPRLRLGRTHSDQALSVPAQLMQVRAAGRASSLAAPMGWPHTSHVP